MSPSKPADRAAALAAGAPKVPRAFLLAAAVTVAVLGLGGAMLDRIFPSSAAAPAATSGNYPPPFALTTPGQAGDAPAGPGLPTTPARLMGLQKLKTMKAPPVSLTDASGTTTSLSALRGKVVILTFFDSKWDDICPVMEAELARAYTDLGPRAKSVRFLTVNSDPVALGPIRRAAMGPLARVPIWEFLSGPLSRLDAVWRAYGVAIDVQTTTGKVSHNQVMYFIDPSGEVRYSATPFADQLADGTYHLPAATERQWATAIAGQALRLLARATPGRDRVPG